MALIVLIAIIGIWFWHSSFNFKGGAVETRFYEYIVSLKQSEGNQLIVAELNSAVSLNDHKENDQTTIFGKSVDIPKTWYKIDFSAHYNFKYYINLDDSWNVNVDGNVLTVDAPKIRLLDPPAINESSITWSTDSAIGVSQETIDSRKQNLLSLSKKEALKIGSDDERMKLAELAARRAVAHFVKNFIQKSTAEIKAVRINFPGGKNNEENVGL